MNERSAKMLIGQQVGEIILDLAIDDIDDAKQAGWLAGLITFAVGLDFIKYYTEQQLWELIQEVTRAAHPSYDDAVEIKFASGWKAALAACMLRCRAVMAEEDDVLAADHH